MMDLFDLKIWIISEFATMLIIVDVVHRLGGRLVCLTFSAVSQQENDFNCFCFCCFSAADEQRPVKTLNGFYESKVF